MKDIQKDKDKIIQWMYKRYLKNEEFPHLPFDEWLSKAAANEEFGNKVSKGKLPVSFNKLRKK